MKYLYFLILSIFIISETSAQTPDWQWAVHGGSPLSDPGGNFDDEVLDMETDEQGNTYVYAIVNGFAHFDTVQGPSYGGADRALTKYNCNGGLEWVRFIGGQRSALLGGMTIGKNGNIYINGQTEGSGSNPSWYIHDSMIQADLKYFQVGFDPDGNRSRLFVAPNQIVGSLGSEITTGADGFLYSLSFGSGGEFAPGHQVDTGMHLIKMDTLLNLHWIKTIISGTTTNTSGNVSLDYIRLSSDHSSNLYISGYYKDSLKIGGQTLYTVFNPQINQHVSNGFVAKYDNQGNFLWVREFGDYWGGGIADLAIGSDGIYLSGAASDSMIIGKDTLQYQDPKVSGAFVGKLDVNGNGIWARPHGGIGGIALAPDEKSIWITGSIIQTAYFDTFQLVATNIVDPILAKYDTSGNVLFATNISSTGTYQDRGTHITTDPKGNVYVGGTFEGTFMTADTFTSHGGKRDVFLIKYGVEDCEDTTIDGIGHLAENSDDFQMYPNPATSSIYLTFEEQPQLVQVYDFHGRLVAAFDKEQVENSHVELDISTWTQGIYFVSVTGEDGRSVVRKLVKME